MINIWVKHKDKLVVLLRVLSMIGGILLVAWVLRKQDFQSLWKQLSALQWGWYFPVLGWTLICHWMRALRWKMLLKEGGAEVTSMVSYHCLMSGYFINFPTGKLGEAARCLFLNRKTGADFGMSFGTVLVERVVDVMCLAFVLMLSYALYFRKIHSFVREQILFPAWHTFSALGVSIQLLLLALLVLGGLAFYFFIIKGKFWKRWLDGFRKGITSAFTLRKNFRFWVYTFLIWVLYFLMTYTWFFGMGVHGLGGRPGLALLVISLGGIGRSLPVPGHGMGSYHFFAMSALVLGGLQTVDAIMIPIVIHGGQTLFYLIAGSSSFLWVLGSKGKTKPAGNAAGSGEL